MAVEAKGRGDISKIATALNRMRDEMEVLEHICGLVGGANRTSGMVVITDAHGNIEFVNREFTRRTGYIAGEVVGKNPRILKSSKTSVEEYRSLWRTITSGGEWRGRFCNRKKNGELYWESASILPIKTSRGVIIHFIKIAEEITRTAVAKGR